MQKKLIAAAIAGLASGVTLAQTNVTVYGIADVGYVYSSGNAGRDPFTGVKIPGKGKFSGLSGGGVTAGNRLGFKGEEALGNGLKAVFTLEYGLNLDDNSGLGNTGGLNARQQFVGLASKFGTLSLGRQYAPGFNATANNDALEATDMAIQSNLSVYAGNSITPNSPARYNNSIAYTSNTMAGFTVSAIYGFGEATNTFTNTPVGTYNSKFVSTTDSGKIGLGVNYANGPINLDAVYQSRQNVTVAAVNPPGLRKDINEWYVGGSWDFKVVKAYASYQALDNNNTSPLALPVGCCLAKSNDIWTVGLSAPVMSNGLVGLSYGRLSVDNRNAPDGDSWGWGAMYQHNLSKRTALYIAYTYLNNDRYSVPVQTQVAGDGAGIGQLGESNYTFGTGIRHSF
ncbi:MAG: porin [Elusimicrobia bacterium]|nr:MAG: porin [Elusimicrobiota bacterium]